MRYPDRSVRPRLLIAFGLMAATAGTAGCADAQSWRTMTASRQAQGEKALSVSLEYGAGRLNVTPSAQPLLYQMRMRYDEEQFDPLAQYDRERGHLELGMRSREKKGRSTRMGDQQRADVQLSAAVPLDLELRFGAGEARMELGGMAIRDLKVSTGASETRIGFDRPNRTAAESVVMEAGAASFHASGLGNARARRYVFRGGVGETVLDFSGSWTRSASASVKMGMGSLTLRLPREIGVMIRKESFLTSFDHPGLVKRGDEYYSSNWASAEHKLTLEVEAAFGSIDIEWIDAS